MSGGSTAIGIVLAAILCAVPACGGEDCPQTIDEHCATSGCAPLTWDAAATAVGWGYTAPPCATTLLFPTIGLTDCAGGTHRAGIWGTDSGRDYYYTQDGALYRIEDSSANNGGHHTCVAGVDPLVACDNSTYRELELCAPMAAP